VPRVYVLLMVVLLRQAFDPDWVLEVLRYRQQRNHAAYLSPPPLTRMTPLLPYGISPCGWIKCNCDVPLISEPMLPSAGDTGPRAVTKCVPQLRDGMQIAP
jgi:hypothetical protein